MLTCQFNGIAFLSFVYVITQWKLAEFQSEILSICLFPTMRNFVFFLPRKGVFQTKTQFQIFQNGKYLPQWNGSRLKGGHKLMFYGDCEIIFRSKQDVNRLEYSNDIFSNACGNTEMEFRNRIFHW